MDNSHVNTLPEVNTFPEVNTLPEAPVFRKKIVNHEIYTKEYPGGITSIKTIENFLVISSLSSENFVFFDVIDTETEEIIISYQTKDFYSNVAPKSNIIDLKNGKFILQYYRCFLVDIFNKKATVMKNQYRTVQYRLLREYKQNQFSIFDSNSTFFHYTLESNGEITKTENILPYYIGFIEDGIFISDTKFLYFCENKIVIVSEKNIIQEINHIFYVELIPKIVDESEYFVIVPFQGFWYFKNDQPKYFSFFGINMIVKIDENIFLITTDTFRIEICDLSGNKLKSLNKLQMNSFGKPEEFQMLKNLNLVSYFGNTLKIWGTHDFVSLGVFQFHFPFIKKIQLNDLNFRFQ